MNTVAVVIPVLNEEVTVARVVEAFHRELPQASMVVVDNGSTDRTREVAEAAMRQLGMPGFVLSEPRRGKGNAVRRALLETDADVTVIVDGDDTYPAESVRALVGPILEGDADMVVADRLSRDGYAQSGSRRFHRAGNWLIGTLVHRLFGAPLVDVMSGYRALGRAFVESCPILAEGFQLETELTLHALDKRFRIFEVPVRYSARPPGSHSKLSTFADGARVLWAVVDIFRHYRPLAFFGLAAALCGALGLLAGVPVFADWIAYRYIYHVPLAVLAASLEIVGVMSLGVGLILDSIRRQHLRDFEVNLIRTQRMDRLRTPVVSTPRQDSAACGNRAG